MSFHWCLIGVVFGKRAGLTGVCGRQRNPEVILIVNLKWRHIHWLSDLQKETFGIIHELEAIVNTDGLSGMVFL